LDGTLELWFENAPQEVVAIFGLDADGGEFGLYLSIGGGKESR